MRKLDKRQWLKGEQHTIYSVFPFTPDAGNPVSTHPTPTLFPNTDSFNNVCSLLAPAGSLGHNRFPSTVYSLVSS